MQIQQIICSFSHHHHNVSAMLCVQIRRIRPKLNKLYWNLFGKCSLYFAFLARYLVYTVQFEPFQRSRARRTAQITTVAMYGCQKVIESLKSYQKIRKSEWIITPRESKPNKNRSKSKRMEDWRRTFCAVTILLYSAQFVPLANEWMIGCSDEFLWGKKTSLPLTIQC